MRVTAGVWGSDDGDDNEGGVMVGTVGRLTEVEDGWRRRATSDQGGLEEIGSRGGIFSGSAKPRRINFSGMAAASMDGRRPASGGMGAGNFLGREI
ncbi:hypothetical protein Tco_0332472 [Tanacetum coccineum]